ncbi:MAG TPA: PIN domain-containing protein [Bryobacteraceae bacterium]|jgi:predicted nucleic-acid-binding protein|nr:PIN domain-containing protein [Bryobacteraceae bacterium]
MRAVDTNVLVRIIARDDSPQTAAADRFIEPTAWISSVVLAEAAWVLRRVYKLAPPELVATIETLLGHRNLVIQDAEAMAAALELFRARPALGFNHCVILETARRAGHRPLGTFDRALGKVDGTIRL